MMRTAVMAGTLAEFDLPSVMQVVSLGRQYTSVELLDESGNVEGSMLLKSGRILGARSGARSGIDAVSTLLRKKRQGSFSVYRVEPLADAAVSIGSVDEVLRRLMENEATAPERAAVMEGSLAEFDLMNVLQVISIGRQFTGVELTDPDGRVIGSIELKSGKVVAAQCGVLTGIPAIGRMLRSPPDSRFMVHRLPGEVGEQHLGSLAQILMNLTDLDESDLVEEPPTSPKHAVIEPPPAPRVSLALDEEERSERRTGSGIVEAQVKRPSPVARGVADVPVVAVTSPKGGSGKTTISINLGIALARQGKRVILVDADFNGILLALNGAPKPKPGAFEVAAGTAHLADAVFETRIPKLRLMPSGDASAAAASSPGGWRRLFRQAQAEADIVLVDTSAGARGPGGDACAAATHAVVVLPAEPAAIRALPAHLERLESLGGPPPKVVGVLVNMLDYRAGVSIDVLRELCRGPWAADVFDIPIARSPAFMEAVASGVPVCRGDRADTPTIGWVFEMIAGGIQDRLGIAAPVREASPFLLLE